VVNGPNLNRVGTREPELYGRQSLQEYVEGLAARFWPQVQLEAFQSHHAGHLIDHLYQLEDRSDRDLLRGIVLNPGAYTHTSLALGDCVAALTLPVVEVHLTNIFGREVFRQHSYVSPHCRGVISGFGLEGYRLAVEALMAPSPPDR
jgi:3-dehydroquinate dehydratase-2